MATRPLKEMPLSELLRIAETPKGKAFLLGEAKIMAGLIKQIHAVVGGPSPPEPPPAVVHGTRKRAKKSPAGSQKIEPQNFDGTVASLANCYLTAEQSPFHRLRHKTRVHYDYLISRIVDGYGHQKLAELKAQDLNQVYDDWKKRGKIATGHATVTIFRILINFGAAVLQDSECQRLSGVFNNLIFKQATRQIERLTAEQVMSIISKAHEMGITSIALAQALQFDCALTQRDVIGEWVPVSEPGVSDVIDGAQKWLRGLRWEEINSNLILRHTTSKQQKDIEFDLKLAPRVMQELARYNGKLPARGPIILNKKTQLPYTAFEFRRQWRMLANACGIPKNVKNMDSLTRRNQRDSQQKTWGAA